jgi:hypothetical protein
MAESHEDKRRLGCLMQRRQWTGAPVCTLITILLLASCGLLEEDTSFDSSDKFRVQFFSGTRGGETDTQPGEYVFISTDSIYPCCNWTLDIYQRNTGHAASFDINGIDIPDMCLTALGPATFESSIHFSEGQYLVEITNGHTIDQLSFQVSDTLIRLVEADTSFIKLKDELIWRYRENTFVYSCGTTEATAWMYSAFQDSLLAIDGVKQFWFSEEGQIPYPRKPAGHYVDHDCLFFSYSTNDVWEAVKDKLIEFTAHEITENTGVGLYVRNYKNDSILSWMYD